METIIFSITTIILVLICYLIVMNNRLLRKVVTYKKENADLKISDERYFELNNKIQLIIVVSSILLLIGGFSGYNSIKSIKDGIDEEIGDYQQTLIGYDTTLVNYQTVIADMEEQSKNMSEFLNYSMSETNRLQGVLNQLQTDYSFNVNTYMVSNIKIEKKRNKADDGYEKIRVYFKDLETIKKEKLPKFKKPPFVSIQNIGFAFLVMIEEITTDYFEYKYGEVNLFDDETGKEEPIFPISEFDILITSNK